LRAPGIRGGIADRPALDRRRARGNADDDLGALHPPRAEVRARLGDEVLDHVLGDLEVGDHAVAQRADGAQVLGRLAEHQLGVVADARTLCTPLIVSIATTDGSASTTRDRAGRRPCWPSQVDRQVRRSEPQHLQYRHFCVPPMLPGEGADGDRRRFLSGRLTSSAPLRGQRCLNLDERGRDVRERPRRA
jgi:hypothetical protein